MQDFIYYLFYGIQEYPSLAIVIGLILLVFLYFLLHQVHALVLRICALGIGVVSVAGLAMVVWPDESIGDAKVSNTEVERPAVFHYYDKKQIEVFSFEEVTHQEVCEFEEPRRLKSMKSGFFIPLAQFYDLLLFKHRQKVFTLQIRNRHVNSVVVTQSLYLKHPLVFKLSGHHYKVFYEYTDGVASVISVAKGACTESKINVTQ